MLQTPQDNKTLIWLILDSFYYWLQISNSKKTEMSVSIHRSFPQLFRLFSSVLAILMLFTSLRHKKKSWGTGSKHNLLVQDSSSNSPTPQSSLARWKQYWEPAFALHWLTNYFCSLFGRACVSWRQNCMRDHSKTWIIQTNHLPEPGYNFWQFSGTVQFTIIYSAFKYYEQKAQWLLPICPSVDHLLLQKKIQFLSPLKA